MGLRKIFLTPRMQKGRRGFSPTEPVITSLVSWMLKGEITKLDVDNQWTYWGQMGTSQSTENE